MALLKPRIATCTPCSVYQQGFWWTFVESDGRAQLQSKRSWSRHGTAAMPGSKHHNACRCSDARGCITLEKLGQSCLLAVSGVHTSLHWIGCMLLGC